MTLKPANLSFEEAVAIPYGGLLAMHFIKKGNIQKQQRVLIYGASGSIGTSAVQLAKYFGAKVTGVCGTSNVDLVESLGADKVVDYTKETITALNERFDFILDAVGKRKSSELKLHLRNILAQNGKYISVDDGTPVATLEHLKLLINLAEKGQLKTVIDRTYPLEQIVEAHSYVDQGHKRGNVIIIV
jgi:NADPH:quinone reductase-like Zn-dependent oxidoreductase